MGSPLLPASFVAMVEESEALYRYAFRNNVEMIYFNALEQAGELKSLKAEKEEIFARQGDTLRTICRLSSVLQDEGIAHAVTKTLRPYPGTPNDVDCLYLGALDQYEAAGRYLQQNHYRLTGPNDMQYEFYDELHNEAFNKDKSGGRFYIDFYRELAADHMPYMDSRLLADHVVDAHVEGCSHPVKVFATNAEMVVLSLHSVVMHRIVPLEVIYTYSYYMADMDRRQLDDLWALTRRSHAEPAMRTVLSLMEVLYQDCFGVVPDQLTYLLSLSGRRAVEAKSLRENGLKMPHVVKLSTFVITVFAKLRGKRARRGFLKELAHMLNPVFAVEVLHHMLSKKYIDKHSDHV